MKNVLLIALLFVGLYSCEKGPSKEYTFYNKNGTIVSMDAGSQQERVSSGKSTRIKTSACMVALIRDNADTTQYFELSTCDVDKPVLVERKWFYNHHEGDTVHFDYIRKDRYFTITPK